MDDEIIRPDKDHQTQIKASDATDEQAERLQVLMIDLENCPGQINDLLDGLDQYAQVVICYAQSGAKVPLHWIHALSQALISGRLKIIRMPASGKNAADFGISFYAGMLAHQLPEAEFTIVSNDSDLDHVVLLLRSLKHDAKRSGNRLTSASTANESTANSALSSPQNALGHQMVTSATEGKSVATFCAMLLKQTQNRPCKVEGLMNSLKSHLYQSETLAQGAFDQLKKRGVIVVHESKVTFNNVALAAVAVG